jgi:XTP/dITP diphosphohydrolase
VTRDERSLLLATSNEGKANEFRALLPSGVRLLTMQDVGIAPAPEVGETFAANAAAKALHAANDSGVLTLADDSGLEVDALRGAPGVHSARYAGTPVSDARNREKLLAAMQAFTETTERTARFRCVVALALPGSVLATAEGVCHGSIAISPRGFRGFGYDPVFVLPDGRAMAEIPTAEKNLVSHRAEAYRRILPRLYEELGIATQNDKELGR